MAIQDYSQAPPRNQQMSADMATEEPQGAPEGEQKEGTIIVLELYDDGTVSVMSQGAEEQKVGSIDEAMNVVKSMAGGAPAEPPAEQPPAESGDAEAMWNQMAQQRPPQQ